MKKHLFVILTALIINYFTQAPSATMPSLSVEAIDATEAFTSQPASSTALFSDGNFRCDGRQYCSEMSSREEAEFFLQHCPNTKLDGDNDGIPCEKDIRW